jgi:hypothetical protein
MLLVTNCCSKLGLRPAIFTAQGVIILEHSLATDKISCRGMGLTQSAALHRSCSSHRTSPTSQYGLMMAVHTPDNLKPASPSHRNSDSTDSTMVCASDSLSDNSNVQEISDSASRISSLSSDSSKSSVPAKTLAGWPQLAEVMANTPDFAAFPRFRDLNTKSLLYYQVQLKLLGKKLHDQEIADQEFYEMMNGRDSEETRGENCVQDCYAQRADFLVEDRKSQQFKLVKEVREVLKEYSKCLP